MDIKYIHDNDIHEKYILDQLDKKEKQEYEAFLKTSPQAREELQQVQKMIAGIRATGKDSMRREIEEQVALLRNPKTDWSILYKAAAVLFIFVLLPALFYYHDKFADQQQDREQIISEAPPATNETKQGGSGAAMAEEEAKHEVSVDKQSLKTVKIAERSDAVKRRSAGRGQDISQKQDVLQKGNQDITAVMEKAKNNPQTAKEPAVKQDLNSLAAESLEKESSGIESDDLDEVLGRVSGAGKISPSKNKMTDQARMETPSGIISMDYLPPRRTLTFKHDNKPLIINFNRTNIRNFYPDILKVLVKQDSLGQTTLDMYVPDKLHSFERSDIKVEWEKDNLIDIVFADSVTYQVKLQTDQKTAVRVK